MRRPAPHLLFACVLAASLATAACTDRNPAAVAELPNPTLPPAAVAMLTCTASVAEGTLACQGPDATAPSGVSAAIIGGQGAYVLLASTGASYDSTAGTFRMDVTLQNRTAQALGTANGVNVSPEGVRVFFSTPPVATQGTGAVEVANADGEGFFTAAAQKFFRYDGILAPGDTSDAKEWRFSVPKTVATFSFGVYVAAPVRAETGWMSLYPLAPTLDEGHSMHVEAILWNVAGYEVDEQPPVSWTTSNPAVVTVDSAGWITAVSVGSATVTASAAGRTASVRVIVDAPGGPVVATVNQFQIPPGTVKANGVDTLLFWADYSNPYNGSSNMEVRLRHPTGAERICRGSGGYCWMAFEDGSLGGTWRVELLALSNRAITHAELLAAGAPAYVYVESSVEDHTAPTVDSIALTTPSVTAADSVRIRVGATDAGIGVERAEAFVSSADNPQLRWVNRRFTELGGGSKLLVFANLVPAYYHGGTFTLDSIRVQDFNAKRTTLTRAELTERGVATQFTVTGTTADTVPPTITAFSFNPDTIVGNGADPVTVTLSASEPASESGVWFLDMEFEKLSDRTQVRRCLLNGATRVPTRTMTCNLTFGAADVGAWSVRYIRVIDWMDNTRELNFQQLQAAGYPTRLTVRSSNPDVTPPTITGFSFSPDTVVGNGVDSISVALSASEPAGETGLWYLDVVFERESDINQRKQCILNDAGAQRTLTLTCKLAFTAADAGAWRVRYIRAIDVMFNSNVLFTGAAFNAGYPVQLTVTAP
jgi:hypothetical protein